MAGEPVRVVLADDAVLLREGIARVLREGGFEVVGQAGTPDELLALVREQRPDVAIVDIRMPPTQTDEGIRAAERIRDEHGGAVGVLVLSQFLDPAFALQVAGGADRGIGYLLKDRVADLDDFSEAVRRVARGGTVIDPAVVRQLIARPRTPGPLDELTPRERDVLALMAEGRSNQAIAARLVVGEKTVETHIANVLSKLDLLPAADDHRRVLAVLTYLRASNEHP
jgi:DNA-binding NarL/FixJ family response regulator